MFIVIVDVWVKADSIPAFIEATKQNASASVREAGIARFDVLRDHADPAHFQLIEVYRSDEAPAEHKRTAHYEKWRNAVEPMMAKARSSTKFENVFPGDEGF
jgi:autoinducer 2-degrading protein